MAEDALRAILDEMPRGTTSSYAAMARSAISLLEDGQREFSVAELVTRARTRSEWTGDAKAMAAEVTAFLDAVPKVPYVLRMGSSDRAAWVLRFV